MDIALFAPDSKLINIPLMKLAQYHKSIGDNVGWFNPMFTPDLLYISKLYRYTPEDAYLPNCPIIRGGTGYNNYEIVLPEEIENIQPDYSIYPDCNYSLQLFSRGCNNSCEFCDIPKKEGIIRPVIPMNINPKSEWVEVLDNYKGSTGKKYKSDYRAILSWVVDKYKEKHNKAAPGAPPGNPVKGKIDDEFKEYEDFCRTQGVRAGKIS